jgi:ATP-dependent RNA helicase DeaD
VNNEKIDTFLPAIMHKLEWLDREELIKKFVSVEFNRFLDYYKNTPDLNVPDGSGKRSKEKRTSGKRTTEGLTRFFINLGKTDDLRPVNVIGMINDYTNIRDIEIGEIEILKNFSFFEADKIYTEEILTGFTGKVFKKRKIILEVAEGKKKEGKFNSGRNKKRDSYKRKSVGRKTERKRRRR